jgi:hypothetical protein
MLRRAGTLIDDEALGEHYKFRTLDKGVTSVAFIPHMLSRNEIKFDQEFLVVYSHKFNRKF